MSNGENLKKIFGLRIAKLRNAKGISQEYLAELADISPRMLSSIETGTNFTKAETIENIAKALNISIQDLIRFDDPDDKEGLLASINQKINFFENDIDKLRIINEILQKLF